ncbi:MAG: S41 family peptidase [Phycisphaerales bacterium]|nr:MAG: S41 family peptidase [Phycisphaerales bacterium]
MSKRNLVWMGVIVAIMAMFYWLTPRVAQQDSLFRTYAPLVEVDAMVRQHFVGPIDESDLVDGAIRGMMRELDPYSHYIAPEEMDAFGRSLSANYDGIGVTIGMRQGRVTVITPIEESPAAKAGILAGDVILAVDGISAQGLSEFDVTTMLAGAPGTEVLLTVRRAGADEEETVPVVRGPVVMRPVKGVRRKRNNQWDYLIDAGHGIGCIRVADFRENTVVEFDRALSSLGGQGVRAIVIDLRFNGGGLVPRAVEMIDRFVDKGEIVSVVTRKNTVQRYWAKREGTFYRVELAVLINGATASAAEIVAGALQDFDRAVIVGTRSFGKGSVQRVRYLRGGKAAVRMTEAHYVLPSRRIIHRTDRNTLADEWGVIPDVIVPLTELQRREIQRRRRQLDGVAMPPATSPAEPPEPAGDPLTTATAEPTPPEIWIDPQLAAAVDILIERLEAKTQTQPAGPANPSR